MNEAQLEMINFARNLHCGVEMGVDYFQTEDDTETFGEAITRHLKLIVSGLHETEYKLLSSFAMMQSSLCSIVPVIQLLGDPGSGKSQALLAIAELSGQTPIAGGSTGASLKNHINSIRWVDPSSMTYEKNCLLLVDNANASTFESDECLAAFLNGYNRKTDRQFISNGRGENIEFRTFCPKLFTSVWHIESKELARRTLVIKTKKTKNLANTVELDAINWSAPAAAIATFWEQPINWQAFASTRKELQSIAKPRHSKEHWILLRDLLTTGIVTEVFHDTKTAIDELSDWLDLATKKRIRLIDSVIIEAIENYAGCKQLEWATLGSITSLDIPTKVIKQAIDTAVSEGLIERPKLLALQECLLTLGFKPARSAEKIVYRLSV
ncbi:hypothetical protein [Microcoleus sp. herbarium14]|uniref:hypothetical protein n=1 Tax=Microcoleus sp. herbarium14 TaxID=3055439 RepID=UPI002FD7947A